MEKKSSIEGISMAGWANEGNPTNSEIIDYETNLLLVEPLPVETQQM